MNTNPVILFFSETGEPSSHLHTVFT